MKLRPYESQAEAVEALTSAHGWVLSGVDGGVYLVTAILPGRVYLGGRWVRFNTLLDEFSYPDGSPCGVKE